jgi:phage terminase small subunit
MNKKDKKVKLSDKQKAFCHYYIIDWNATKAAILAGYSHNCAQQIGSENLLKPVIQAYIEEIQKDIAKEAGISFLSQVMELKKVAYTNISDMFKDWVSLEDFNSLSKEQKSAILEISYKKDKIKDTDIETEFVKLKLHDKIKAIQEINKMLGYSVENIDLTSKGEKISTETTVKFINARKKGSE